MRPASSLSLYVLFPADTHFASGTVFSGLKVSFEGRVLALSQCRFQLESGVPEASGRLVFTSDVYDCRALCAEGRIKTLLSFFQELPLVLAQRENIKPEFRAYVADLNFDLSAYKKFFNEQDRVLAQEPAVVAQAAQQLILHGAGAQFFGFLDKNLALLSELVSNFTPEEHERHGYYFRQQLWPFIVGSEFMKRTNLKPRGYAGDSVMMELLYDNQYVGHFAFNKLMHKHPLDHAAAQAVRNRRDLLPRLLAETAVAAPAGQFRVLSVACGPARELEGMFKADGDFERFAVTLVDQDVEALAAAKATVARIEAAAGKRIAASFVSQSVRTLLKSSDLREQWGTFRFIYSMGLFDYLTPPVARAVLARIYDLLEAGGVAVIGNYHVSNPSRYYMAYWLDWTLYHRTEEEMLALAAELPRATRSISFDASGSQMFLKLGRAP
ncbi:MAG: class I SAM-dependent methyltransferase [Myxococcales bacterium]